METTEGAATKSEKHRISRSHVLAVQDLEGLLERRNLLLAPGYAVPVAHTRVDALRLEFLVVLQRGGELLLRSTEIGPLLLQALLVVLLLSRLVVNVRVFRVLVCFGVRNEVLVFFRCLLLASRGLGLKTREIRL